MKKKISSFISLILLITIISMSSCKTNKFCKKMSAHKRDIKMGIAF